MAERTSRLASFNGDAVTVDLIYDDVLSEAMAVLYTNTTDRPAAFTVTRQSNGVSRTFQVPGQSFAERRDIPAIPVTFNSRGYLLGVSFGMVWPSN
jgi:hypothetical protein